MEKEGVLLDIESLERVGESMEIRIKEIEAEVFASSNKKYNLNKNEEVSRLVAAA